MKYRKKPVVIEAFQYNGDLMCDDIPEWVSNAYNHDSSIYYAMSHSLYIKTLEGPMHISLGDYIIQGINGEIYPCKPDIFAKTYEEVV
jgi:hypothetical protein